MTRYTQLATITVAAYAALTLAVPSHASPGTDHSWHAHVPAGCAEVGHFEDGTVIATCGDGSKVIAYDPDGQTHPGFAYRAAGTWYAMS